MRNGVYCFSPISSPSSFWGIQPEMEQTTHGQCHVLTKQRMAPGTLVVARCHCQQKERRSIKLYVIDRAISFSFYLKVCQLGSNMRTLQFSVKRENNCLFLLSHLFPQLKPSFRFIYSMKQIMPQPWGTGYLAAMKPEQRQVDLWTPWPAGDTWAFFPGPWDSAVLQVT